MKQIIILGLFLSHFVSCDHDSRQEGTVRYYDGSNNLLGLSDYKNGLREGVTMYYYSNGLVKDSINFINDKEDGYIFHFDSSGILQNKEYAYYGLKVGPSIDYSKGKPIKYSFTDFNKTRLFVSHYDSLGRCKSISAFTASANTVDYWKRGKLAIDLSVYLPRPPGFETTYKLGITNSRIGDQDLIEIKSTGVYWDTLLPVLEKGSNYYVSTHLFDKSDSIDKLVIEEIRDTLR